MKKDKLRAITDPYFKEESIDPSEIEVYGENIIDEYGIMDVDYEEIHNVASMTIDEKKELLIDWISKAEEYTLDGLITQHLNL